MTTIIVPSPTVVVDPVQIARAMAFRGLVPKNLKVEKMELYGEPPSEKLTIAVFLAESPWGDIDDSAMDKGLGGRETALVSLAMEWAKTGHDVYAFVPRESVDFIQHEASGGTVRWIPNKFTIEVTEAVQPDLFISWENIEVLKALADGPFSGITAIEMQVAHLNSDVEVADYADFVCVLSDWAGAFIRTQHDLDVERVPVFPNGVSMERFARRPQLETINRDMGVQAPDEWEDYMHFIYSSSPDRGLHHLLRMWPEIQTAIMSHYEMRAILHVCYGVEGFVKSSRWAHREDALRALTIEELIGQPGVVYHGKIGQDTLAQLMMNCDAMLYPADTMSPTETGCISIVEALAAGLPVVTTDCDCIGPEFGEVVVTAPLPFLNDDYHTYINEVVDVFHPEDLQTRIDAGREFAEGRDWSIIAQSWIDYFQEVIKEGLSSR